MINEVPFILMVHLKHQSEFVLSILNKGLVGAGGRGILFALLEGSVGGFVVVEFGFEGIGDVGQHFIAIICYRLAQIIIGRL